MQDIENQLDMFEESPKKTRVPPPKPKFFPASISNLADMPTVIKPFTVVRLSPTTIMIWND